MMYDLPKSLEVCGETYEIRSDYRAVLDICAALSDIELSDQEKAFVTLTVFYPDFETMPQDHYQEALKKCFWFIDCGSDEEPIKKAPKLVDWEQDFQYIISPINRVIGREIRSENYLHWWSFISAYHEIGDCLFAQIVRIRDKKSRGKPLDKQEKEWYRKNRNLVDFKQSFADSEKEILEQWGV